MTNKTKKQMNKAEMKKAKGGANVSYMERKGKMLAPNTKSGYGEGGEANAPSDILVILPYPRC